MGDGKFVGAHHDENGGITGPKAGDQTGDEISVDSYAVGYTAYYRYKGAMNVETAGGKVTSAQAVSGKTKDDGWDGMSSTAAKTKWFNGLAGPDDACATYPEGQCTWGACVAPTIWVGSMWASIGAMARTGPLPPETKATGPRPTRPFRERS